MHAALRFLLGSCVLTLHKVSMHFGIICSVSADEINILYGFYKEV